MNQNRNPIGRSRWSAAVLVVLTVVASGCSASTPDQPAVNGRRVQNATVVAQGGVPFQVSAYELVFADSPDDRGQARRAALLVEFLGDRGHVRGFAEWDSSGKEPRTYVAGGWARQRYVDGELVTVFDLALDALESRGSRRTAGDPARGTPLAVRVVVHEGSGDVTLTARR